MAGALAVTRVLQAMLFEIGDGGTGEADVAKVGVWVLVNGEAVRGAVGEAEGLLFSWMMKTPATAVISAAAPVRIPGSEAKKATRT